MTDVDPLAGTWRKLRRAGSHLHELENEAQAFARNSVPMYSFRKELQAETGRGRYVVSRVRDFPTDWALIIGDVLNNSRTALDHLAWVLVKGGSTPAPRKVWQMQFPICTTAAAFDKAVGARLPGMKPEFVEKVKNRQPIPGVRHFATFACLADLVS